MTPSLMLYDEEDDDHTFTWVIKDFRNIRSQRICSDSFIIDSCKWRVVAYPRGDGFEKHMSLYLEVADYETLPHGWRRRADYRFTVVNSNIRLLSAMRGTYDWFDQKNPKSGYVDMIAHDKLNARHGGFVVNGDVMIVVNLRLFDRVGKLDVSEESNVEFDEESDEEFDEESGEESEEASCSVKRPRLDDDGANFKTRQMSEETVEVHGFRVYHSQVNHVSRIFRKYPDIALGFRAKNQHLRTGCMNVLLGLIESLSQSPQELSDEDLLEAGNALAHVKGAGFKVDWLDKKLKEVKERKKEEQGSATQIRELEEKVKDLKQKWLDMEVLLEEKKRKALTARASLTLYDFL